MAHTCPDCGQLCHCGGDIDDIDFGEDCGDAMRCTHYLECQPDSDVYEEDDFAPHDNPVPASKPQRDEVYKQWGKDTPDAAREKS